MRSVLLTAVLSFSLASGSALAQEAATPEATPEPAPQAAQPAGPPTSRDDVDFNQAYLRDQFTDWSIRCIKLQDSPDVCEMHQALSDGNGTRTAEINLFPLNRGQIAGGGTIVTPLETILTENVRVSVDGGEAKAYPFTFCNRVGCVAQVGFLSSEIDAFRRGRSATVRIVPLAAPDQEVTLEVSLAGFTAAYQSISE